MKIIDITTKGISNKNAQTKTKTILLEENKNIFKIQLNSNTYDFQSDGWVSIMGPDKKWETIKKFNLPEHYNVKHSYQYFNESDFDNAIKDLKKFIKNFARFV